MTGEGGRGKGGGQKIPILRRFVHKEGGRKGRGRGGERKYLGVEEENMYGNGGTLSDERGMAGYIQGGTAGEGNKTTQNVQWLLRKEGGGGGGDKTTNVVGWWLYKEGGGG